MFEAYILPVLIVVGVGLAASVMLVLAAKFMAVEVDERVEDVRACLPGANCGGCGYAGCDDYAVHIVSGEAPLTACTPGGTAVAQAIGAVLGQEVGEMVPMVAVVNCSATKDQAVHPMDYIGRKGCLAASLLYNGDMACQFGCLGYGDCVNACRYDAIHVVDGLARVDKDLCTGCGACSVVCPHNVISINPHAAHVVVACSNTDKGAQTRKKCATGCIGCKKCEKQCEYDAIHVVNNLAVIDFDKCTSCGKCADICPQHVIENCFKGAVSRPEEDESVAAEA